MDNAARATLIHQMAHITILQALRCPDTVVRANISVMGIEAMETDARPTASMIRVDMAVWTALGYLVTRASKRIR